jgi:ribose transport system permease protein
VTSETAATPRNPWLTSAAWRRLLRDQPLIPLTLLLLALVIVLQIVNPGIVTAAWAGVIVRQAVPLAILAGCQTLAMLTGGIDLSVGAVASMAAFVMATLVNSQGPLVAILAGLGVALLSGLITGVGIGVFKVHPLIMTLGMSLVVLGFVAVYQLAMVLSGIVIPDPIVWLGSETTLGFIPNSVFLFVPLSILIVGGLRRSGYGRLLFAIGDNAVASRLAGVRIWQVLVVLYTLSALLAAIAGFLVAGLNKTASPALVESAVLPSVAAAVIGGTSILGGRGGFAGTIVGALILTLLNTLLTTLNMPEAMRQVLFGAIIVVVAAAYTRVTGEA